MSTIHNLEGHIFGLIMTPKVGSTFRFDKVMDD